MTNALLPWVFFGGLAVTLGGLALINATRNRKRRAAYAEYCLIRGFMFEDKRPNGERRYAEMFEPFTAGRRRSWGHTISGTKNQAPFTAFEYQWITGGGKSSSSHWIGGIVWEHDKDSFPKFALSPEGWLSRLGQVFGMQDIDFDESPEFSRMYQLKGSAASSKRRRISTLPAAADSSSGSGPVSCRLRMSSTNGSSKATTCAAGSSSNDQRAHPDR